MHRDQRPTGRLNRLASWFDKRLAISDTLMPMLRHPIPRSSAGPMGWWYIFGSASMTLLMLQILTGIGLALVYVPSADKAYDSLIYLNYEAPLGWFLRALHYYAGSGMVALVLAHATQVFLHGAYKYPRELTWMVGVVLLLCTLGMFFTGQVMRWDPDAYWGIAVGGSMAGRAPVVGPQLVHLVLGGVVIGGDALSRFFTLHVFVIPGVLLVALAVHLWLVLKCGISAVPVPGQPVDPDHYDADYQHEVHTTGVPFLGPAMLKDVFFSAIAVLAVVLLAAILGPKGPTGPPDPLLAGANPRPEWPFLWLFALLSMSPPEAETFIILVLPIILIAALFMVPLISNRGERAPSRRPMAVLLVVVMYSVLGVLTYEGATAPWSPQMTAWSGEPVPVNMVRDATPVRLLGAAVFQYKNCRNCHALDGLGGKRGPDLAGLGTRLTPDQIIDQISNGTPGGGNMPAYGKQVSPNEMTAMVEFLSGLRPAVSRPLAAPLSPINRRIAMSPTLDACLRSWPWNPWLLATSVISVAVYFRGWRQLAQRERRRWHGGRLAAFVGGMLAIFLALASPIEPLAALLLQVHMVQHLLLTMVAPPLLWLSDPLLPLLIGLPEPIRRHSIAPLLRSAPRRRFARQLTRPATALVLFVTTNVLWHVPASYELALRSSGWHYLQHACFFGAGLVFWYPIVQPYPSRPCWPEWLLLPYLILADVQNTLLSALLTFSGKVLYSYYAEMPRIGNISPLEDQSAAGVIMWVPGSVAFLAPLFWIGLRLLYGTDSANRPFTSNVAVSRSGVGAVPALTNAFVSPTSPYRLPVLNSAPVHSRTPAAGLRSAPFFLLPGFLRWRYARMMFQIPLLLMAGAVIYDGLRGPQASPLNLAGVLPWIHWRGLLVLGLLGVGNLSCMACPFTLPRRLANRWLPGRRHWPRALRSKWLAVALVGLFLWAYEAFSLWDSPWWTAWITIGYFVTAFAIDGFFRGAAFCKYVCPIGQFNFVQSLVSPLEVSVRDQDICATCHTKDCIRGRDGIPGCELDLFQPRKSGNMDCTFCLDCVQACPHANVGLVANAPGSQLWHDRLRSGVGRLGSRTDIAALVLVLVFGAFANAAGMVRPVIQWEQQLQAALGTSSPRSIVTIYYLLAVFLAPLVAVGLASNYSCRWAGLSTSRSRMATRYAYTLVPLGFAMWLSHYGFHLFTSYQTIVPTTQRFAADLGLSGLGEPRWSCACCAPAAAWLLRAELLFLDFGFLLSLYSAYRLAFTDCAQPRQAWQALIPWSALIAVLFLIGIWIVFQPMQMRGTMAAGG